VLLNPLAVSTRIILRMLWLSKTWNSITTGVIRCPSTFNMQAFPPGAVTASNTKFKPKIQIDHIRNFVHTWHDYSDRANDKTLSEEEEKAFTLFKRANKAGNKWIKQYKTFELNFLRTTKVILHRV